MHDKNSQMELEGAVAGIPREAGFGPALSIRRLTGGVVNQVFRFDSHIGELVMRLNKNCLPVFLKERWAMEQAARAGVNVPRVHAVGEAFGYSYMIMDYIHGTPLSSIVVGREEILVELGRQVRLINGIEVEGYGFHFAEEAGHARFTKTWHQSFVEEYDMIFAQDNCVKCGALSSEITSLWAKGFLAPMKKWQYPARLCHGDLSYGNVQVCDDGRVFILDWTQTKGGVAPLFDLAGLSVKDKLPLDSEDTRDFQLVCQGYGLSVDELRSMRSNLHRVALADVLRAASWAYSVNHENIEKFREDALTVLCLVSLEECHLSRDDL